MKGGAPPFDSMSSIDSVTTTGHQASLDTPNNNNVHVHIHVYVYIYMYMHMQQVCLNLSLSLPYLFQQILLKRSSTRYQ